MLLQLGQAVQRTVSWQPRAVTAATRQSSPPHACRPHTGPLVSIRAASSSSEAQLANGSSSNVAAPAAAVPAASAAQPAARPASPAASRLGSSSGSSSSAARPLVPALDVNELLQTLLADAGDDPAANTLIGQAIPTDGGCWRLLLVYLAAAAGHSNAQQHWLILTCFLAAHALHANLSSNQPPRCAPPTPSPLPTPCRPTTQAARRASSALCWRASPASPRPTPCPCCTTCQAST